MVNVDIKHQIIEEVYDTSFDILQEVLDFMRFLKSKQVKIRESADVMEMLPKHRLGQIHSSLRREEIYDDAR